MFEITQFVDKTRERKKQRKCTIPKLSLKKGIFFIITKKSAFLRQRLEQPKGRFRVLIAK